MYPTDTLCSRETHNNIYLHYTLGQGRQFRKCSVPVNKVNKHPAAQQQTTSLCNSQLQLYLTDTALQKCEKISKSA